MSAVYTDEEAEAGVLGCFICHPQIAGNYIATECKAENFTGANVAVYHAILQLWADSEPIEFVSICGKLRASGELEKVGGPARINDIIVKAVVPASAGYHINELKDKTARRRLSSLLADAAKSVANPTNNINELLSRVSAAVENIGLGRTTKRQPSIKELTMDVVKRLQARFNGEPEETGVSTGLPDLDKATGGLRAGAQWVIAGPPKGAKSALALSIMRSVAIHHKKRCLFFGLEMPSIENVERLVSAEGGVSANAMRDGTFTEGDMQDITRGAANVGTAPVIFRDDVFDLAELIGTIRQTKAAYPDLFAVFVDYAQLLTTGMQTDNREREVATISRSLRQVSMQQKLCIVLLSQLNDDGKLRESRTLGMDATKIIFIELPEEPGERILSLVQRDGPAKKLYVAFVGDKFRFHDLEREEPEEPKRNERKRR